MAETAQDYGTTVDPAIYISGIGHHLWLGAMYARMIERVIVEVEALDRLGYGAEDKPLRIYDAGCGPGHFTTMLAARVAEYLYKRNKMYAVSVIGIDVSPAFIEYAQRRPKIAGTTSHILKFINRDVRTVGSMLPPAQIITTSGLFHHFKPEERQEAMRKVAALIEPGGILVDGDEHIAEPATFENRPRGKGLGKYFALCALYFQVIAAADSIRDPDLVEAEVENFLAEAFRDDEVKVPDWPVGQVVKLVTQHAHMFMHDLIEMGLNVATNRGRQLRDSFHLHMLGENPRFRAVTDRGDFKMTLREFVEEMTAAGMDHRDTYDPGNCDLIGSAPVTVFRN